MSLYKYTEDGLGSIYGVGAVYPGLVVDSDALPTDPETGEPLLDLSKDSRFEPADSDAEAASFEEISHALGTVPAEAESVPADPEAPVVDPVDPSPAAQPEQSPAQDAQSAPQSEA